METMNILRLPTVLAAAGHSRSTFYNHIAQGLWPRPVSIGQRAVGWPSTEVNEMNKARIAGKSDDEIRTLVKRLESDRKRM